MIAPEKNPLDGTPSNNEEYSLNFNVTGMDDFQRQIDAFQRKVEEIHGEHKLSELLTPAFLRQYTQFTSIEDLIEKSGFNIESQADFDTISQTERDAFIASHTQFSSWDEMLHKALEEYLRQQIGLLWWSQKSRQFLAENKTKHNHSRILVSSARIDLRWRLIVQRLMKPLVIVKREIRSQVAHRVWNALVIFDIYLLIFDTAP